MEGNHPCTEMHISQQKHLRSPVSAFKNSVFFKLISQQYAFTANKDNGILRTQLEPGVQFLALPCKVQTYWREASGGPLMLLKDWNIPMMKGWDW